MTDFQVGDKIRVKRSEIGDTDPELSWEVAFIGEHLAVIRSLHTNGSTREFARTLDILRDRWEVVPETFEAGKRYQRTSIHSSEPDIGVLWADDSVAFGRYMGTGKHQRHALLYPADRVNYKEV